MKKWYSTRQAAEYTGYAVKTLQKYRETAGKGPKYIKTAGGMARYREDWLDEWIEGSVQAADLPA